MIRIICPECKNAYLQKAEANFTCPGCNAQIPESEENFLAGAQYYHEGDFVAAGDCLMKYIVKNGAEPRAIFYKALCDAQNFDEDTSSLKDLYVKILESLIEISDDDFVRYLAMANDEVLKVEKALTQTHLELFADADAEKIKKEVSAIIKLQDEAKIYRNKLNEFANSYNERATNKISVKLSPCFFVDPDAATDVGAKKYEKIVESINSHTVFTGILSNEIKNLEIYYRCIVMFFEKNRRKYEFLMSSAEKFSQIAKLLEDGRYASIKGVSTICEKLKAAGYDFFQESLRDHDDEFEQQTETVVVMVAETVEIPAEIEGETVEDSENTAEITEFEDVYSSTVNETEDSAETEAVEEIAETEETVETEVTEVIEEETAEETSNEEVAVIEVEEVTEESVETEETSEVEVAEEEIAVVEAEDVVEETPETEVTEDVEDEEVTVVDVEDVIEETAENEETSEVEVAEDVAEEEIAVAEVEDIVEETTEETETNNDTQTSLLKTIAENGNLIEDDTPETVEETVEEETEAPKKRKHKKSFAPIIAVVVVLLAIIGLVAFKVVPAKLNESNYAKADALFNEKNYEQAAILYEKLGDYEDSEDKYLLARYNQAGALEAEKKYDEAKVIYISLGNYEDCAGKINSCTYNSALMALEQGKYDEAITVFSTLDGYADSESMIDECNFQKAVKLIEAKDYENAINMLMALKDHPESENKILEAKYAYVTENLNAENETTLSYLKDLAQAKYKDSGDLRNKLLGTSTVLAEGISTCINYSETDTTENLEEVDNTKNFYFHVTVTDEALYTKKLTLVYETSAGYGFPDKSFVLTENENTYTLTYPADPGSNYSITFSILADDNTTLISQKVALK